jgi:hypothetical protein
MVGKHSAQSAVGGNEKGVHVPSLGCFFRAWGKPGERPG